MRLGIEGSIMQDLRNVLVKLRNAVWSFVSNFEQASLGVLPAFNERTPAARVTGKGMNRQWGVARDQFGIHERAQQQNRGRRITTGIRHAWSFGDLLALTRHQF